MNVKKYNVDHLKDTGDFVLVRNALQSLDGVHRVWVDGASTTVSIEFDNNISEKQILNTINNFKRPGSELHQ